MWTSGSFAVFATLPPPSALVMVQHPSPTRPGALDSPTLPTSLEWTFPFSVLK